jgi:hypothetical protein
MILSDITTHISAMDMWVVFIISSLPAITRVGILSADISSGAKFGSLTIRP